MVAKRETPPLSVDVSELLRAPGSSMRVRSTSRSEGLGVALARVEEGSEVAVDLELEALVDGIHVTGALTGSVAARCARCLTDITLPLHAQVSEVATYPGRERDDAYPIVDEQLDVDQIVRDVVVGDLPFSPLCRPDCAGLCLRCGADRNEVDCGHDAAPVDIRWGPLASLKDRLERDTEG